MVYFVYNKVLKKPFFQVEVFVGILQKAPKDPVIVMDNASYPTNLTKLRTYWKKHCRIKFRFRRLKKIKQYVFSIFFLNLFTYIPTRWVCHIGNFRAKLENPWKSSKKFLESSVNSQKFYEISKQSEEIFENLLLFVFCLKFFNLTPFLARITSLAQM